METVIIDKGSAAYPMALLELRKPPARVYSRGRELAELLRRPRVAIVGSRNMTNYGRQVTRQIARDLAEQGIVIVSGLALGVDAQAHEAALEANGLTLAVLPSPVETVAPATNQRLADRILGAGGGLVSEYPAGSINQKYNFVARNQLVAALSDVLLITEAALGSGSLHTANFALDLGRDILAVPGNISSPLSVGTNNLIRTGAQLVTSAADVLHILNIEPSTTKQSSNVQGSNPAEQAILQCLASGVTDGSQLLASSRLSAAVFNQSLTMLEINGKIVALGANHWGLT